MTYPKISIITPSFNQAEYLEETILSILDQNYPNLEYIIIDGGSTDCSVEIIKKYEHALKYWVSEADNGQVDALNKGLKHCTGDIFNWINSDDYLEPKALIEIAKNWEEGFCVGGFVKNFNSINKDEIDVSSNKINSITEFIELKSKYHQPGIWLDLKDTKKIFPIEDDYHYYFDKIMMIKYFIRNGLKINYTNNILANFRVHDFSKTSLIQNSSYIELIDFYTLCLKHKPYQVYRISFLNTLDYYLIPYKHILEWRKKKYQNILRLITYLLIGLKNPMILKSRIFYTLLKNEAIIN
jgi:glycosyltransferase involved in cell wall biosynthesis